MTKVFLFLGLFFIASLPFPPKSKPVIAAKPSHKKIFIGVDGLSREAFDFAVHKKGYFKTFTHVATHIAPFPSISDYSWNMIVGAQKVMGKRGRIKSYEAAYFDRDRNKLVSDVREYFRRLGEDHHYFHGAFQHYLNPYIESLLYVPTEELPKLELRQLKEAIVRDERKLVSVMVASSDALAHTRENGLDFLGELDQFLLELHQHYQNKNEEVEIILVSDHGQAAGFFPGHVPKPLKAVDLKPLLKKLGLNLAQELKTKVDVAMPLMALANYGSLYFHDLDHRSLVAQHLRRGPWFKLGLYPLTSHESMKKILVFDQKGEAELTIQKKAESFTYRYHPLKGNPLHIVHEAFDKELSDAEARSFNQETEFPDAFHRLAVSAFELEADFPDFLFTVKDEYYLSSGLDSFTSMYQTHGSLGRRSSSGIVASTHSFPHQNFLRSSEILSALQILPQDLFQIDKKRFHSDPVSVAQNLRHSQYPGIETDHEDISNRRIFKLINRLAFHSQFMLDSEGWKALTDLVSEFKNQSHSASKNSLPVLLPKDLAMAVDEIIKTGKFEELKGNKNLLQLKTKFANLSRSANRREPSTVSHPHHHFAPSPLVTQGKKLIMRGLSTLHLFEKALTVPEVSHLLDDRDLKVWMNQFATGQEKEVFGEIFKERKLVHEIYPTSLPVLYNPELSPLSERTLVYIPGIYNSIFDDEIFQLGLAHLRNTFGLRIISPPVFSTCSSSYNGKIIADFLIADFEKQIALGRPKPRYFLLGYSKGGVDALHAFTQEPTFVRAQVDGLLTMASPLKGTAILDKADLPSELVSILGAEKSPAICQTTEKASSSITPQAMALFYKSKLSLLTGLTRYYSLSFTSAINKSHVFMRATKNIARFNEPNDGVVPLSSSRFPDSIQALDLGVIEADHLAGIQASSFPQEALLESLMLSLLHMKAFDPHRNAIHNQRLHYQASSTKADEHRHLLKTRLKTHLDKFSRVRTRQDLRDLGQSIYHSLLESHYAVHPFRLDLYAGKYSLVYSVEEASLVRNIARIPASHRETFQNEDELIDLLLSRLQFSGRNLLGKTRKAVPESTRQPVLIPQNDLTYHEDQRIDVGELPEYLSRARVTPLNLSSHPHGWEMIYDHASSVDFRKEFFLSFESRSPMDGDDNSQNGWDTIVDKENTVAARLSSHGTSFRLSTFAFRFLAKDFPDMHLKIQVKDDVANAQSILGGNGKDDSAFQLWLTFRVVSPDQSRLVVKKDEMLRTLGYYFGDEIPERKLELNKFYENYFSKKDFVIAVLPESRQKLIGIGAAMLNQWLSSEHNLIQDLKVAYPDIDPEQVEILGITIQHDSNDTRGNSEALFKELSFHPRKQD